MNIDRDLFPGFRAERVGTPHGPIFVRMGGSGPPLLLLHGYPQTHVMWHSVADQLQDRFTLVACDLPGYGASGVPASMPDHAPFSKRTMAAAMLDVMAQLGHPTFGVVGHDRGGRVAYRMALDHPGSVQRLAVLDILPTYEYWHRLDRKFALAIHHWMFLAQPAPVPEQLISADSDRYFGPAFESLRGDGTPVFEPRAVEHYLAAMRDPERVRGACEDYRAGATIDVEHDAADLVAGRRITMPLLALWGSRGVPARLTDDPLEAWRRWAEDIRGAGVAAGHFLCEEEPDAVVEALAGFFGAAREEFAEGP